nr:hypothetical protein [uncultured Lichenicoccus sp.]
MPTVFVSDAILEERLVVGHAPTDRVTGLHGWKALSALYQGSLVACGYRTAPIVRPEIYQTGIARRMLGVEPGDWHLAVKPIEHLRPFHGVPNVFVCNWPFAALSSDPLGGSPFFDQVRLLRLADAVLCCTDFTRDTLRAAGVERAVTVPPCITPPPMRERDIGWSHPGCRFLSIVEAGHLSRQLGPTIAGFAEAARLQDGLSLVICVQGADARILSDLRQSVAEVTSDPVVDETISIIGAGPEGEAGLYGATDFLLCADAAAGLHLPLVDALLAGVPPVTTLNAGTGLLPREAAVAIATERPVPDRDDEPIGRFIELVTNPPTADAVRDAVLAAAALDHAARSRMAGIGRQAAGDRFSLSAFSAAMGRLGALVSLPTP